MRKILLASPLLFIAIFLILKANIKNQEIVENKDSQVSKLRLPSKKYRTRTAQDNPAHEGQAVMVGPYRVELSIGVVSEDKSSYAVFISSSKGDLITPGKTDLIIKNKGIKTPDLRLSPVKSGTFYNISKRPDLPETFRLTGVINNRQFSADIKIDKFRKNLVLKPLRKKK